MIVRKLDKLFVLFVVIFLVATCPQVGFGTPGRPAPSTVAHSQVSLSPESARSAATLLVNHNVGDKVDRSALDSRWVHVPEAQARRYAHCGNAPHVEKGRDTTANVVWLTIDDHPAGHEEKVNKFLAIGDRYNVRFRFFPVSGWTNEHPEVITKLREAGHEVNNHTRDHVRLDQASDFVVTEQVTKGVLGGPYFRPPYGAYDHRVVDVAKSVNQAICMWTINTADYSTPSAYGDKALVRSPQDILRRVQEQIGAHAVILMHLHGQYTLEALPMIIEWLREHGYKLELLHRPRW